MENEKLIEAQKALNNELIQFVPRAQRLTLKSFLLGEEGAHFAEVVLALRDRIADMPQTYDTDGQGNDAVVYLHYFGGPIDAWVTEKDMGDAATGDNRQVQAFGKMTLTGDREDAEWGYISIEDLMAIRGVEIDLYWTPKPMKEVV